MDAVPSLSLPRETEAFDRKLSPRPLGFHVMMSAATWLGGAAALPALLNGLPVVHDSLSGDADALRERLRQHAPAAINSAICAEALRRMTTMIEGITRYQTHPYRRHLPETPVAIRLGSLTVRDYAPAINGPGIFCVPSLINPPYILDLAEGTSLMRYLAAQGLRPFLADWGHPEPEEYGFTLTDYVRQRLVPALETVVDKCGGPVILAGYCMGGNLALALALHRPDLVRGIAFLATPWDFHAESATLNRAVANMIAGTLTTLPAGQPVPIDALQIFFASLDPTLSDRKFRRFAGLDPASPDAERFVAIEDWANDGMPLVHAVASECLHDWYGRNTPGNGVWEMDGLVIDPAALSMPALVAVPRADRIVPPKSALALAHRLKSPEVLHAPAGHVAMVAGPRAEMAVWSPLVEWTRRGTV